MKNKFKYNGLKDTWRKLSKLNLDATKNRLLTIQVRPDSESLYKKMFDYFKIPVKVSYLDEKINSHCVQFDIIYNVGQT